MRVLIIKLTSMGDLMHALPALTDAVKAIPDIEFDWVVDKNFSEVPLWHPAVKNVITTAHRQWKKNVIQSWRDDLFSQFNQKLNKHDYDLVIDLQNNMKSATVSWLYKGDVHGLDKGYCREKFAYKAYKHRYAISENQHAIKRIRQILSQALAYPLVDTAPDYGANFEQYDLPKLNFVLPEKYLIFVHNASWLSKIWPLASWQGLINKVVEHGYSVLLPSGNDEEHQRAQQIAAVNKRAHALPRLTLNEIAALTYRADGAMCSDTGLAHLAAVAGIPAQTIYGATDRDLIGTVGQYQHHIVSEMNCAPCYKRICPRPEAINGEPVCMDEISIETAWDRLKAILPAQ
jgi:heptosyltransferase-1|tara:strand:+ start:534 stop:1571 length:1038 start_codon:yes stop_codon:yes gene_type:complete